MTQLMVTVVADAMTIKQRNLLSNTHSGLEKFIYNAQTE